MPTENRVRLALGAPNPKQAEFFLARSRFVAYGGARGGGKSWAVRKKAVLMAAAHPGIRLLLLRRTYPELRENHILPLQAELRALARYSETQKAFAFCNGSRLRFGYCENEADVLQYQGQEYDVIFMDEATQFTEYQFVALTACLRGMGGHPKRMALTCNPGGVGHGWVKRLFIDRDYRGAERPDDYTFVPARVYDNTALLAADPDYVQLLESLPLDLRRAWLDGDWNVFAGQFFREFSPDLHVAAPFDIPPHWRRTVTLDYGLDMLAAYLIATDEQGCAWVAREVYESDLIVSEAAAAIAGLCDRPPDLYLAPPDLWSRRQESGRSVADIFAEQGIHLTLTSNDRVAGWMAVKEWLKPAPAPRLRIFDTCKHLIRTLPLLQYDATRHSDAATTPHEVTHAPDALRGFCVHWTQAAQPLQRRAARWSDDLKEDYRNANDAGKRYLTDKYG